MRERVVIFGEHGARVGIVTVPPPAQPPLGAVILTNVGTHHRIGPFRLYVDLARELSIAGWIVLRFDLAGFGDSDAPPPDMSHGEAHAADLRDALDMLETRFSVQRFVLLGLCSGVDSVHAAARDDARVSAAILIDGHTYPTPGFQRRRQLRVLQPGRVVRYLRRTLDRYGHGGTRTPVSAEGTDTVFTRDPLPQAAWRADVGAMLARGTRLLFVFTGSVDYRYNAADQLYEQLEWSSPSSLIRIEHWREVDHLFSTEAFRRRLADSVVGWLADLVAASEPATASARLALLPSDGR